LKKSFESAILLLVMKIIATFLIAHWYLSLFSHTFFLHRYACHKSFTMSKFWERFFFVFTYVTQGSSYMSPRVYTILHRLHHAYADTEHDPHSPSFVSNPIQMMIQTSKIYVSILHNKMFIEEKFTKNIPCWLWFDKWGNSWHSRILWVAIYVWFYAMFSPSAFYFVLIPIHILMGPLQGVIINWFGHRYGNVNFDNNNTSKNLFRIDVLMLGEGYHNNHHKFPSRSKFAVKKGEIDFCYFIIALLNSLKIIHTKDDDITGFPT
jgi:stearoyl-CoA desaturase (delta-9 desaturase)